MKQKRSTRPGWIEGVRSADPPCFHPHFVWSLCSVPVGVLDLRNGCCYLERGLGVVSTYLARPVYAVTRTRRSWRKHTAFDLLGRCRRSGLPRCRGLHFVYGARKPQTAIL